MNPLLIAAACVALICAVPVVRWMIYDWRQWAHAKHIVRIPDPDYEMPAEDFYGSMNLDDERQLGMIHRARMDAEPAYRAHHEQAHHELDWRERTMAELAPEALDPGPGVGPSPMVAPGPDVGLCDDVNHSAQWSGVPEGARSSAPVQANTIPKGSRPGSLDHLALERLADTGDIRDAVLLADTTTYMRDQDADVQDWLAGRAITWARLEIGALT